MKISKNKFIVIFLSIILVGLLTYFKGYYQPSSLKYSQEYVVGKSDIKGTLDVEYFLNLGEEFEIGANKEGYAVFKNPIKALNKLKTDYKEGLELIQKENNLLPINQLNYNSYKNYGWQATTGSPEEKEQARFITSFIDIYENRFNSD